MNNKYTLYELTFYMLVANNIYRISILLNVKVKLKVIK